MSEHLLFPVDFSEPCTALADYVVAMAAGLQARLTLLHVLEIPPPWYSDAEAARLSSLVDLDLVKERRRKELESYLEDRFRELAPVRLLLHGDPAGQIAKVAAAEGVTLIMMPTRGMGPFRRFLLGSVTGKVLHDSPCPVWTNSHSEHAVPARYPVRTVVCAVDLSENSVDALNWTLQFASVRKAEIHVVHAIQAEEESANRGVVEVRKYLSGKANEEWQRLQRELGIRTPLHIAYGSIGTAVRKAAHDLGADLVVTARGRVQNPLGRLWAHSYSIIRESPCPVISV